ncbi:helix-turn-helix transcriptional regulator [bacterium]|nr:helix-turn-helix transcriptional regulator [bacterium]
MNGAVFGEMGLWRTFVLYSAVQGLVLAGHFLLRRSGDPVANRWLALVLLLISVHVGETVLTETSLVAAAPWASGATWFLVFLVGPAYWFHLRSLVRPDAGWRRRDLLHVVPALVILVDGVPWLTAPAEQKIAWQRHLAAGGAWHMGPRLVAKVCLHVLQNGVYLVAGLRLLREAEGRLAECSADTDVQEGLGALRAVIRWFGVWSVLYLLLFLGLTFVGRYGAAIDKTWMLAIALSVQATALVVLHRPDAFGARLAWAREEPTPAPAGDGQSAPTADPRYSRSLLDPATLASHRRAFEDLMENDKLFRDRSLRLADLAARLGISAHHLSQTLNRELGGSFFEVVNGYRVAEVQRLMALPASRRRTLLALAFDAGFNNKNSFNRAFRQVTGETPSAYWGRLRDGR